MVGFRLWQIMGWTMLHYLWVGAALGAVALLTRHGLRRAAAGVRYLAALASLSLLSIAPAAIAVVVVQVLSPIAHEAPLPLEPPSRPETTRFEELRPAIAAAEPAAAAPVVEAPAPSGSRRLLAMLDLAVMCLPWLWVCGAPLSFALTTAGLLGAERLRRQSRPLQDARITELCRQLAVSLRISCRVGVAVCDRIAGPILVGVLRPMILLPAAALAGWSPQQLEMVLWHELAHVRRLDNLVNLLQRIVESLLFFQPLVWVVSGWVRREREHCCDELVVARTGQPHAYAEMLVDLAETFAQSPLRTSSLARPQAVASMAELPLIARIRRILKQEQQTMQVSRKAVAMVLGTVLALALLVGGYYCLPSRAEDAPAVAKEPASDASAQPKPTTSAAAPASEKTPAADTPAATSAPIPAELQKPIVGKNFVILPLPALSELQRNARWWFDDAKLFVVINGGELLNDKDTVVNTAEFDYGTFLDTLYKYKLAGVRGRTVVYITGVPRPDDRKPATYHLTGSQTLSGLLQSEGKVIGPIEIQFQNDRDGKDRKDWPSVVAELTAPTTAEAIRCEAGVGDALVKAYRICTPLSRYLFCCKENCAIHNVRPLDRCTPEEMQALPERAKTYIAKLDLKQPPKVGFAIAYGTTRTKIRRAEHLLHLVGDSWWGKKGLDIRCYYMWDAGKPGPEQTLLIRVVGGDGRPVKDARVTADFPPEVQKYLNQFDRIRFTRQDDGRWGCYVAPCNDEFTLTVAAPGYQASSQKMVLPEGAKRELEVRLKPAAPKANDPSGKTSARGRPEASPEEAKLSRGARRVLEQLDSPTSLECTECPLGSVVDMLARLHAIKIRLDREALHEAGIAIDVPITRTLKGITLDSALRLWLGDLDLAHLIRDDGLLITTESQGRRLLRQGALDPAALPMPHKAAAMRKLADALKKTGSLSVTRTTLDKVCDILAAQFDCNIQRDIRALDAAGLEADLPCTLTVSDASLASIVRQLGLGYVARDEVILITPAAIPQPVAPKADDPSGKTSAEKPAGQRKPTAALTYTGRVSDRLSGKPIAGATVTVLRRVSVENMAFARWRKLGETKCQTDAKGEYTLSVPPNQAAEENLYLDITVEHPDYVRYYNGYSLQTIRRNVKLGGRPFFENISLLPGERISGAVVTPEGKPAAGVLVRAFGVLKKPGDLDHLCWSDVTTDAKGHFQVIVVKGGDAVFWIIPEDYAPSTHLALAKRGDFGPFVLKKGIVLKGRVVNVDGKPVPNVWVNAEIRGGPAKQSIGMPVFDYRARSALSDGKGEFVMAPLPAGVYNVMVADQARDGRRYDGLVYPLPAAFVNREITLDPSQPTKPVEIRAVPCVLIGGRFIDSSGKPTSYWAEIPPRITATPDGAGHSPQFSVPTEIDQQGKFIAKAPKGFWGMLSVYDRRDRALRIRVSKEGPLNNSRNLDLGTLVHDLTDIAVIRYVAPVLLVGAAAADGKPIRNFQAKIKYQLGRAPYGEWIRDGKPIHPTLPRGDVNFERQGDGRWRSTQLLPDEQFTLTAEADGYQPQSQKLSLPEGAVKELTVKLQPAALKANDPSGKTSAQKPASAARPADDKPVPAAEQSPAGAWTVPQALVGTWEGKAKVCAPPENGAPGQIYKDYTPISIRIAADGNVDGHVGSARLVGCKVKSNRGQFGKMLHLWTDYIISDGRLEGPVYKADREGAKRSFSIPFNLDGGTLKGGFMLLQPLEYPFPLFPRLQLTRRPIAEVPKPKPDKPSAQAALDDNSSRDQQKRQQDAEKAIQHLGDGAIHPLPAANAPAFAKADVRSSSGNFLYDQQSKPYGVQLSGPLVTDVQLKLLKDLPWLNSLYLLDTQVTDAGLEQLKELPQLEHLVLQGPQSSSIALEHFKGLTQLHRLELVYTTDAGLEHVKGLTQLRRLELYGAKVTDAGLKHLTGLTQLKELDLNGSRISGRGLDQLKGLSQLQEINVDAAAVTYEDLQRLQRAMPRCRIWIIGTVPAHAAQRRGQPQKTHAPPAVKKSAAVLPEVLQRAAVRNFVIVPFTTELQRAANWKYGNSKVFVLINGAALLKNGEPVLDTAALDFEGLSKALAPLAPAGTTEGLNARVIGLPSIANDRYGNALSPFWSLLVKHGWHVVTDEKCNVEITIPQPGQREDWASLAAGLSKPATEEEIRRESGLGDDLLKVYPICTPLARYLYGSDRDSCVVRNMKPLDQLTPEEIQAFPARAKSYVAKLHLGRNPRVHPLVCHGDSCSKANRAASQLHRDNDALWKAEGFVMAGGGLWEAGRPYRSPTLLVNVRDGETGRPVRHAQISVHYSEQDKEFLSGSRPTFTRQKSGCWVSTGLFHNEEFRLIVQAPGYRPALRMLKLPIGEAKALEIKLAKAPPAIGGPPPGEAEREKGALADALRSQTPALEFTGTPLPDVVEFLRDQLEVEIQIDQQALHAAGMKEDLPITCNLKGISLQSALRFALGQVGLTYAIRGKALLITTPRQAATGSDPVSVKIDETYEKRIATALESPTQLQFTDTPLADVVEYVRDYHKIEVQFDRKALKRAGIRADAPVTTNVKGVALRTALSAILHNLGLGFEIRDEMLLIAPKKP